MRRKERREFRREARSALRKAVRKGTIDGLQRGQLLLQLSDDVTADEMADVVLAQAVECKLLTAKAARKRVKWAAFGEDVDWEKLAAFILKIVAMFGGL